VCLGSFLWILECLRFLSVLDFSLFPAGGLIRKTSPQVFRELPAAAITTDRNSGCGTQFSFGPYSRADVLANRADES
jgi:hypothetical protein